MKTIVKKKLLDNRSDLNNPYGSIQKAIWILELLASRSPLGVTEIARELNLQKSGVSRILKSLIALGYALQGQERGRYSLSPRLLLLAHHYQEGNRLVQEAKPILRELAQATRASAHLGILVDDDLMIAAKEFSPEIIQVSSRTGESMKFHASALGKVILAGQPEDKYCRFLKEPLPRYTDKTITDMDVLRSVLREIRQKGYALEVEEEHLGVGCIAAPVPDAVGNWIAAISVAGPIHGTPFKLDLHHCRLVMEKSKELARRASSYLLELSS